MTWLLTCEHYSNAIPATYQGLFTDAGDVLRSHRGYDVHVQTLFDDLRDLFDAAYFYPWSRLLIEPNRSLHHRQIFSAFTWPLAKSDRQKIIDQFYLPYRNQVESFIESNTHNHLIHISLHTFTPVLGNQVRDAEIGLLFDPKRPAERSFAKTWKADLNICCKARVRFNHPYRGAADGFTTYLRKRFPEHYVGMELEVRNDVAVALLPAIRQSLRDMMALRP